MGGLKGGEEGERILLDIFIFEFLWGLFKPFVTTSVLSFCLNC